MNRDGIIQAFEEIAVLLELKGENDFKTQAYRRAIRDLEDGGWDPVEAVTSGTLEGRKGFGTALVEKVTMLVETGRLPYLEDLRSSFPAGLTGLLAIPGLGAKRLGRLHRELGIGDATGLRAACENGSVAALKGFGPASAAKILSGLDYVAEHAGRWLLPDALAEALRFPVLIPGIPQGDLSAVTGELARRAETVSAIELLVAVPDPAAATTSAAAAARRDGLDPAVDEKDFRIRLRAASGIPCSLSLTTPDRLPTESVLSSSTPAHLEALRDRASGLGLSLDAHGLRREATPCTPASEEEFYALLDLPWIAPELREDAHSVARALAGDLGPLVTREDLRGFLHVHTDASDGKNTLEEMAEAIAKRGGTYFGVCDHSQASHWAGGLKPAEVRAQHAAIDAWNAAGRAPFILKGIEADILPDGRVDYDDELLATFDLVVASVHINFQMTREAMTARILRALENPFVDILGHPTGRLLLERPAYPVDLDAVAEKALEHGVILEINANPHRLDLAWDRVRAFRNGGLRFAINTDAHSTSGLENDVHGVSVARRAGVGPREILNALSLDEIRSHLRERRARRRAGTR